DRHRQDAVLEAVVVENIGEGGRDHAAYAEVEQRPWRMLAARAAAEIVAGDEDLGVAIGRLVEHEIGVFAAVLVEAHLREQALAEAGALDGLQIILRDDHVGVDIDDRQRRRDAREFREFVHDFLVPLPGGPFLAAKSASLFLYKSCRPITRVEGKLAVKAPLSDDI